MSQQFPARIKSILEDIGLRLTADALPNGTGKCTLKFYQTGRNKIRADMYPNLPNQQNNGLVRGDMEYSEFFQIMQWIQYLAADTTPAGTYQVIHEDFTFFNKKRSDAPSLIHRTIIGKEEDGRIYISILTPKADDAKVKFYFEHPHLCQIKALGGTPTIEPGVLSARSALAWVASMTALMPYVLVTSWVDKSQQNQQNNGGGQGGGQGGGGYQNRNNNGGGNGGGGSAPAPDADDMPF